MEVNGPSPLMGEGSGGVGCALLPPIPTFPHAGGKGARSDYTYPCQPPEGEGIGSIAAPEIDVDVRARAGATRLSGS
jgi:hypothetical protein